MGAGLAGGLAGLLLFNSLVRWAAVFLFAYQDLEVTKPSNRLARAIRLGLCESLFHSGPWLLLVLVFIGYEVRRESFARPVYIGFFFALLLMSVVTIRAISAMRRGRPADSAPKAE